MKLQKVAIALSFLLFSSVQASRAQDPATGSTQAPADQEAPLRGQIPPAGANAATPTPAAAASQTQTQYEGPSTSTDLRPDSLFLPKSNAVYKTTAEIVLVQGQVQPLKASPVARYRGPHLQFFEMHFKNGSDQVAIIDADNTQAVAAKGTIRHANASAVIKGASSNLSTKGKLLVAGVSGISLGLAGPIFYEMLTPQEHAKRYLGHSIGLDGVRHDVEDGRFGRRLIMPGDETTGWVAFESPDGEAIKDLKIPVWFEPMRSPATYLDLPVTQAASL